MSRTWGLVTIFLLLQMGCGEDGNSNPTTPDAGGGSNSPDAAIVDDAGSGDPILDSLSGLGVNVNGTQRIDDNGNDLPSGYAPFGTLLEVGRIDEFFFLGNAGISRIIDLDKAGSTVLHSLDDSPEPWIEESNTSQRFPQSTRAAGAMDIDGDGLDEAIVVYVDRQDPAANMQLKIHVIDDQEAGFAASTRSLLLRPNIEDINIATGDLNGDGLDDLVVGLSNDAQGSLLVFLNNAGELSLAENTEVIFPEEIADTEKSFRIATGNLDFDRALETAVVFNEQKGSSVLTGGSRYAVYDDLENGFQQLDAGSITVIDNGAFAVVAGDVSIGDVDGDHLDEVVLGGIGDLQQTCETTPLLVRVLDDRLHNLDLLGQKHIAYLPGCQVSGPRLNFAPVNTPDLDGDGVDEISIFSQTISSFTATPAFVHTEEFSISDFDIYSGDDFLDRNSFTIIEGEANGDGRQDLIVYSQKGVNSTIAAWGNDVALGWRRLQTAPAPSSGGLLHAQLVAMNVDRDTAVLRYVQSEQQFVFTTPIVLAALAAPPCHEGIGQFELGCYTTFGNETSNEISEEQVISTTASATVGFKISNDASQTELSIKGTATATANAVKGKGYSYTSSVVYTTGTQEDSVIFTTIPQDLYTYEIVSHPDSELVGKEVVVSLPRSPITLMVEREFYNSHIPDGAPRINSSVFRHTVGQVDSYTTKTQKDTIVLAENGLATEAQSVGQGGGSVEIGLSVGTQITEGSSLEMGWQADVEATGGTFVRGFSVGASVSDSLTVTSGDLSSYTGSVGSLPTDVFAEKQYSFGLFTYVYEDPITLQEFEVVDYWVE